MKRRSFLTTAFAAACAYAVGPIRAEEKAPLPRDFQSEIDAIVDQITATVRRAWENRLQLAYQEFASQLAREQRNLFKA